MNITTVSKNVAEQMLNEAWIVDKVEEHFPETAKLLAKKTSLAFGNKYAEEERQVMATSLNAKGFMLDNYFINEIDGEIVDFYRKCE